MLTRTFEGGTSYFHYDGRGNVTELSDTSGAVSGKYSYDAFGNTSYIFDDANRLVQIVSRNEQGQVTSKSEFVYAMFQAQVK